MTLDRFRTVQQKRMDVIEAVNKSIGDKSTKLTASTIAMLTIPGFSGALLFF